MALRTKIETGNYYNLVMDVDSYSRTNKSIKKKGEYLKTVICVCACVSTVALVQDWKQKECPGCLARIETPFTRDNLHSGSFISSVNKAANSVLCAPVHRVHQDISYPQNFLTVAYQVQM